MGETFVSVMTLWPGRRRSLRPARKAAANLAIIATVFPIVFVGELPDKTMFASLVMSTRGNPAAVWLGAAGAFVVHVVIATTIGVAPSFTCFRTGCWTASWPSCSSWVPDWPCEKQPRLETKSPWSSGRRRRVDGS